MTIVTPRQLAITLAISLAVLVGAAVLAVCVGSTGGVGWPDDAFVLAARRDRVLLATIVGAALGAAGAVYQSVLRNDLADPYLLGIASGAAVATYAWRLPAVALAIAALEASVSGMGQSTMFAGGFAWVGSLIGAVGQQSAAFAGAVAASAIVLGIAGARGRFDPATLVLVGVTVSTICGALILLLYFLAKSAPGSGSVQSVFIGELRSSLTFNELMLATCIVGVALLALFARARRLNVASLSDDEARSLGLRPSRERAVALGIASLVTASAVAVAGPVGFVGLIAPHVARRTIGPDARIVLPLSAAGGAAIVVIADALLRYLAGRQIVNTVIPLGVATSLLGGPFFLLLLARRDGEEAT